MTNPNAKIRSKLVALALEDYRKGDFRTALRRYLRLSGLEPDNPAHLVKLGGLHEKLGSPGEAVSAWFRAAALFVDDAFDLKAVALYKRALALRPGRVEVSVALAEAHRRLGQRPEALAVLRGSREALEDEGRFREALDVRLELAQLEPSNTAARFELARELDEAGLAQEAISEYAGVIVELARAGDPDGIPIVFERLYALYPAKTDESRSLAKLLDRSSMDSVRAQIAETLGKEPDDDGVDDALEHLLVGRVWQETLGQVYREVGRIHRKWAERTHTQ